jgi:hypothetical protein
MTSGRCFHLGEQVLEERRHVVAMLCLPPTVVDPGIGQRLTWRRHGDGSIGADASHRVAVAPTFDVHKLTGFGPISHDLSDQLIPVQRTSLTTRSADPRQRVADQQIDDPSAPESGLE